MTNKQFDRFVSRCRRDGRATYHCEQILLELFRLPNGYDLRANGIRVGIYEESESFRQMLTC